MLTRRKYPKFRHKSLTEPPPSSSIESESMSTAVIREDWEGRIVDGKLALLEWLGGTPEQGVFLTVLDGVQRAVVKLILAEGPEADTYLAQWEAAKALSHPHLMPVLATGHCEIEGAQVVYIVTEHAEKLLAKFLTEKALRPHEAKNIFEPVLSALFYLHENGIVHGHIKPSNIFVSGTELKISTDDFFVAAGVSRPPRNAGIYDAPEAALGTLTVAADAWSVGVSLVEALTQRPPVWDRSIQPEPLAPESLPQPFFEIVRDCLRSDPAQRSSIAAIQSRLGASLPVPVAVEPVPISHNPVAPDPFAAAPAPASRWDHPETTPFPSSLFEDYEEASRSRFPVVPVVLGVLVLLAIGAFFVVRSNPAMVASLLHTQSTPASSQPAPQPQPAALPAGQSQTAPAATPAAPQPQSQDSVSNQAQTPPATSQAAPTPQPPAASPAETQPTPAPAQAEQPTPQPLRERKGGNSEGAVASREMPNVVPSARESMHGPVTVEVRVFVDRTGAVSHVAYLTQGPGNYFARISVRAAQSWKFTPPETHGHAEPSEWTLRFYFTRGNTEVTETQEIR
jgi:serine/threonine protein kinase